MRLPVYEQRVGLGGDAGAVRADPALVAAGAAGLSGPVDVFGKLAGDAVKRAQIQEQKSARVKAHQLAAETHGAWAAELAKAQAEAPEDPAGFTDGLLSRFDQDTKTRIEAAPETARELLTMKVSDLRADLQGRAMAFEAVRRVAAQQASIQKIADTYISHPHRRQPSHHRQASHRRGGGRQQPDRRQQARVRRTCSATVGPGVFPGPDRARSGPRGPASEERRLRRGAGPARQEPR